MEAHGKTIDALYDRAKQAVRLTIDRPHVLRQAIRPAAKAGLFPCPAFTAGLIDKIPFGSPPSPKA